MEEDSVYHCDDGFCVSLWWLELVSVLIYLHHRRLQLLGRKHTRLVLETSLVFFILLPYTGPHLLE